MINKKAGDSNPFASTITPIESFISILSSGIILETVVTLLMSIFVIPLFSFRCFHGYTSPSFFWMMVSGLTHLRNPASIIYKMQSEAVAGNIFKTCNMCKMERWFKRNLDRGNPMNQRPIYSSLCGYREATSDCVRRHDRLQNHRRIGHLREDSFPAPH